MKVWGMGTCFGGYNDQTSSFIENGIAAIGWNEEEAIDLYATLREVAIGDVIYLKSTYPKKGTGMVLRIKVIGKVVNPNKKHEGKSSLCVEYIKNFNSLDLALSEYKGKNSVYGSTFYQEYNPLIIEKILKHCNNQKYKECQRREIMTNKKIKAFILLTVLALILSGCKKEVERVSLNKNRIEIMHGETFVLVATILPSDADEQSVTWSVNSSGVVSAISDENTLSKDFLASGAGMTTVTVTSANGKEATCVVKVIENEEDIAAREKAEEEARIAAEKKAEEEKIAREKAEQEAKMRYETGITYNQLARTPNSYIGQKVKFYGRVVQVIEEKGKTTLRVATKAEYGSYYEDVVLAYYNPSILSSRVLKDDMITLYGISQGLYTYGSTMAGSITVPSIAVEKIEFN